MFDLVEEVLDKVALFVERGIEASPFGNYAGDKLRQALRRIDKLLLLGDLYFV